MLFRSKMRLDVPRIESHFTAVARSRLWPQAALHTQWPGAGVRGDPVFDEFVAGQYKGMETALQERHSVRALIALLDRIGPAVLLTHSQSGPYGWCVADARPQLVKGILAVEPNGPLFWDTEAAEPRMERPYGLSREPLTFDPPINSPAELRLVQQKEPDGEGLFPYWRQKRPARRLPRLAGIPILILTAEASYHAQYDHGASAFLRQAGVKNDHVRLVDAGIHGNGHMMMLEKNSAEIAGWLDHRRHTALASRKPDTLDGLAKRRQRINPRLSHEWLRYLVTRGGRRDADGWRWKLDPSMRFGGFGPWKPEWAQLRLPGIATPFLGVLVSEQEEMGWGTTPDDLAGWVPPNGRIEYVEGAGHFVHIEKPDLVLDMVMGFLDSW